jgi:ABC-type glycerol-3-phosphate transport system substrate-binding protein
MVAPHPLSRRKALKLGAAAAALPLIHVRTAGAAGKVSIGFIDHWVPAGNDAMKKQIAVWSDKTKTAVQADFITSVGDKLLLTMAAEAQAKTGHDVLAFGTWNALNNADNLEPVDDVMKRLTDQFGPTNHVCEYLGKHKDHWIAIPSSSLTQMVPPCGRISVLREKAGIDVTEMYPAKEGGSPTADNWTYDTMLKAAEACQKANMMFGLGLGHTADSVNWVGAMFRAFGAALVDGEGNINVKSDEMRQVLEYAQKLAKWLPADAASYDDASNNRALISGKSALIFNPPSAWAVAKRDSPSLAADCWTFAAPAGPKGRFTPYNPLFWGIWNFSQNKEAAKDLIAYLSERKQVEERCVAVSGYDIPPFDSMLDFKVWEEVEPPKGTVYNYPMRPWHKTQPWIAASEAPPEVAVQIYNRGTMPTMVAKLQSGQSIKDVIVWAQEELEGFVR